MWKVGDIIYNSNKIRIEVLKIIGIDIDFLNRGTYRIVTKII